MRRRSFGRVRHALRKKVDWFVLIKDAARHGSPCGPLLI